MDGRCCTCWRLAPDGSHERGCDFYVEITHDPCCSSHGEPMTCVTYRRTHFVEVGPCCPAWTGA